jgi:hypothetical protein
VKFCNLFLSIYQWIPNLFEKITLNLVPLEML